MEEDEKPPFRLELEPAWGIDTLRFKYVPEPEPDPDDYGLKLPLNWKPYPLDIEPMDFGEIDPEGFPSTDLPPAPAGDGIIELGVAEPVY